MTILAVVMIVSAAAIASFYWALRGRNFDVSTVEQLKTLALPIDLAAFEVLTDPAEDAFLRERVSPKAYRRLKRLRVQAEIAYLMAIASNAAVILRWAEAAPVSAGKDGEDRRILVREALSLRLLCLVALAKLRAELWFPGSTRKLGIVIADYRNLVAGVSKIIREYAPTEDARIRSLLAGA